MRRLEEIKVKVCKEYKYYPWIFAKPLVWIPIVSAILISCLADNGIIRSALSKLLVGFSLSQILLEFNGHKDTIKLLRRLSEIHLMLERWKHNIKQNQSVSLNDIQYMVTNITMTQGEYSKEYDIVNIEEEKNYVKAIKERIEAEQDIENKTELSYSLIEHIQELENQGLNDIRSITGTTDTYFSEVISPNFKSVTRQERRKNKKK